jgi:adenylate cyclase
VDPDPAERKLAAVLSADVVGYSRLMAEDDAATVRTLTAYRDEIRLLAQQHRGRVVDAEGDNLLAEFPSATDAVTCAEEIQRVLQARNSALATDRRMEFRIGVHLGDVLVEGARIYGDGVNIAARLEGLAEPGGICISGEVHSQVHHRLSFAYEDLGEQEVKNIPDPVRVFRVQTEAVAVASAARTQTRLVPLAAVALVLLAVGAVAFWALREDRIPGEGTIATGSASEVAGVDDQYTVPGFGGAPAIAVLPFDNLSGDPDQEYFADGIAEDLITRLSSWRRFPVIARNSSFTYKGKAVDVQQVGRALGARYIVEGSVRKAGDRVRISAQLIDASTGIHVWAEKYDRELRDIFVVQDEIVEQVIGAMGPWLRQSERLRAVREQPRELGAYDLTQRGWWHFYGNSKEDNAKARPFFEQALEIEPSFANAWVGLAAVRFFDAFYGWTDSPAESLAGAEQAARACIAADNQHSGCYRMLSWLHERRGEPVERISALERAISLDPSDATAHGLMGLALSTTGRPDDSIAHLQTAMRLDPMSPTAHVQLFYVSLAHFAAGRYETAVDWAKRSLRLQPDFEVAYRTLAASYAQLGQMEEAQAAVANGLRLKPHLTISRIGDQSIGASPDFLKRWLDGLRKAGLPEE